jgi:nucleoside-diphosphate-sugar epimerase
MTMRNTKRILVTGAAGCAGRAITTLLRANGRTVVAHARRAAPGIDWVADLGSSSVGSYAFPSDVAAVVHCAAAIPGRSSAYSRDNTRATVELAALLEAAPSLRHVVHVSSVAVYKRPPLGRWIISENAEKVDVSDPGADSYASSKRSAEMTLEALAQRRPEVKVTHLRASSIYGPGMVLTQLLPTLVARARCNEPLQLYGPRGYVQNFIQVQDVAELAMALMLNDRAPRAVNAFSDDTHKLAALAGLVKAGLGSRSEIVDATEDAVVPETVYVNTLAKQFHPRFRGLADHLLDAS